MEIDDFAEITRAMIKHENELINHRLTWMATFQGLLAATAGFAWENGTLLLIFLISLVGFVFSISTAKVLFHADQAIKTLLGAWEKRNGNPDEYSGPSVIGISRSYPRNWLHPWTMFPATMVVFWPSLSAVYILSKLNIGIALG